MKSTTSSYVITLKLATNYNDIKALEKRYHIAEIIYNSVIKYARKQYKKLLLDPGYKNAKGKEILAIVVNLKDYNVGADKGGAVAMFEDFDIDYNAQKYLIETRCSGALVKPFSAIVIHE